MRRDADSRHRVGEAAVGETTTGEGALRGAGPGAHLPHHPPHSEKEKLQKYSCGRSQAILLAGLFGYLAINLFDILRLDAMVILGGDAYSSSTLTTVYGEEWSGDHKCTWHHGAEYYTGSVPSKGLLEIVGVPKTGLTFTPYSATASFSLQLADMAKPVSAVRTSGAAATIYAQKNDNAKKVLLINVNASTSRVTTFFAPYPAKYLFFHVPGGEHFSLHNVAQNCQGCDWVRHVSTKPEMPLLLDQKAETSEKFTQGKQVVFQLREISTVSGVGIIFADKPSSPELDPEELQIFMKTADNVRVHVESFNVSSRDYLPPPMRQVFYFTEVYTTEIILIFTSAGHKIALAEVEIGRTCTAGLPAGADVILVSHYVKATQRKELMLANSRQLGLQVEMRGEWTRDRLIEEKEHVAKRLWPGALKLEKGGQILEWYGMKHSPVWKEIQEQTMRSRYTPVNGAFLGRVACMVQHFEMYRTMWNRGTQVGLILEDDTIFVKHFPSLFAKVVAEAPDPDSWDIIFIGGCLNKHAHVYNGKQYTPGGLLWKIRQHRCANGYIVSRRFLRRMLFSDYPRYKLWINVDALLEGLMLNTITGVYWTEPPIVFEGSKAIFGGPYVSTRDTTHKGGH